MGLRLRYEKVLVKDSTDRVVKAESDILQQANLIAFKVSLDVFNAVKNQSASNEASILLQAQEIASRVKSIDFTGQTIASLINQTANEVKIQANKITFEGLVTANSNFKILLDGSIEAVNAKLSGSITATKMVSTLSPKYYGEIGISGGYIGLGLFDTDYGIEAFCEILATPNRDGFLIRDKNNQNRFGAESISSQMVSPNGKVRIAVSDTGVQIIKNDVALASWGY